MGAVSGQNFVLEIEQTGMAGTWNQLKGQKNTSLPRSIETVDASDKDNPGWPVELAIKRGWSFVVSGNVDETDVALTDLEDAWFNMAEVQARIQTPGGNTYTGPVTVQNFQWDGPHDNVFGYEITLAAAGVLTKT